MDQDYLVTHHSIRIQKFHLESFHFFGLVINSFLERRDMSLLVTAVLRVVWSSDKEFESDRIIISIEIALSIKQIDSVKPIIAPALANLKIRRKFPDNLCSWVSMIDHLDPILILLGLRLSKSLEHLKEHTDVVSFGLPISIGVDFESP